MKFMDSLYYLYWLIAVQVPAGGAASETAAAATDAAPGGGGGLGGLGFFLPAMLMVMVLYFMLMVPKQQKKDNAERAETLANLKKNDRIVTAGGILGTIVNNREETDYVTIRLNDDGTKMQVLKASVLRVLSDDDDKAKKS